MPFMCSFFSMGLMLCSELFDDFGPLPDICVLIKMADDDVCLNHIPDDEWYAWWMLSVC